jgi:hypothetical protein
VGKIILQARNRGLELRAGQGHSRGGQQK